MEVNNMSDYYGFKDRDEYIKWLKTLKVGDKVCYANPYSWSTPFTIIKIERITPTGWIKSDNNITFVDGEERGYTRGFVGDRKKVLKPITDEVIRGINESKIRGYFKSISFEKYSYEELIRIYNFIKSLKEGKA
ncbi:hypothetical protein PP654_gp044 [Bacillus phage v_B-Bak10]|uniref:Uncharacterized protein n=2 Tax=Basiliskvirus TaxID=3044670 RepID=A0A385IK28_9CAUD|nr:hypothetical protein PP653_gp054 [Bacillus phage Basilisk]YP_010657005.1 hypothetical protein PP654_gp044 [Bacillus phage v_B-Bak10]AGR46703.1 hypothetical protein BASILISK_113 [Bacillus phage Basilisk]AXY83253.1 hypothetical protein vBBBak10_098 [Bacillus phage v_B-Bak10]